MSEPTEAKQPHPGWGGERPGAGRPVRGEAPLAKVAVTLLPRHIEWATALGGGNLSAGIRKALDIAAENELNT